MSDSNLPDAVYRAALDKAYDEWTLLLQQERELIIRKNQLRQTFTALYPLVYPEPADVDVSSMSLPNAIRLIIGGTHRPLTAIEMRGKLTDLGFDLSKFDNALANIHTAMNRMVESEEMVWADIDEKKALPGPKLKPVPAPQPTPSTDQLRNAVLEILASTPTNTTNAERK